MSADWRITDSIVSLASTDLENLLIVIGYSGP